MIRAPVFGEQCPAGTVYDDDFSTDPRGRWLPVAAKWTWDPSAKTYSVSGQDPHGLAWIGPRPSWRNYEVVVVESVTAPATGNGDVGPIFRIGSVGATIPPPNDAGEMYLAAVSYGTEHDVLFGRFTGGFWDDRAIGNSSFNKSARVTVRVEVNNASVRIFVNGSEEITTSDSMYTAGSIGLRTFRLNATFHRVTVTCR